MIYRADLDGDALLDKKELALWLHKNEQANKAADIKGEFWVSFIKWLFKDQFDCSVIKVYFREIEYQCH